MRFDADVPNTSVIIVADVVFLRKQCRIIGEASGTLPTSTRQNQVLGVPVSLLTEQAFFLMDKGII